MSGPLELVEKHPMATAGVAVVVVVAVLLLSSGGGSTAQPAATGGDVGAGDALQAAMISANAAVSTAQIQADVQRSALAAGIEAANIDANSKNAANVLAAQIAELNIVKSADVQNTANTLQASVINKQTDATVQSQQIASNTTIQTTQAVANALIQQAQIQAGVQTANIQANKEVQTQSWWDSIFG